MFFSKLAGCGRIQVNRRNTNLNDAVEMTGDINMLKAFEVDPECPLEFGRANSSLEIDMKDLEVTEGRADLTQHLASAELDAECKLGLADAQALAHRAGMKPRAVGGSLPKWWSEPWTGLDAMDGRMREADEHDEISDLSTEPEGAGEDGTLAAAAADAADGAAAAGDESDDAAADADAGAAGDHEADDASPLEPSGAGGAADDSGLARGTWTVDSDDGDGDAELIVEDATDTIQARGELRRVIDLADEENDAESGRAKASPHVVVPGRGKIYKQTLCMELNMAHAKGERLSPDRLKRVTQAGKQEHDGSSGLEEGQLLQLQGDVAMMFEGTGGSDVWWIGRIIRMVDHTGKNGRKKIEWTNPVEHSKAPKTLHLSCRWYRAVGHAKRHFDYDFDDSTPFAIEHVISVVHMQYDHERKKYELDPSIKDVLDAAVSKH